MRKSIFILSILTAGLISCKKNQLGGGARVHGTVAHHGRFIANARVFVKFNARELPGTDTSLFDARILADNTGHFSFDCYKGQYYLYAYGFDTDINLKVTGGLPVKVRHNEEFLTEVAVKE